MIKDNLVNIRKEIDDALQRRQEPKISGGKVQLIAISKTQPAAALQTALAAGIEIFGENKVQEAAEKMPAVSGGLWHLVGHLQTNKVKKAVEIFDIIYSVDSERLMSAIDLAAGKAGKIQDILWQVNIAGEKSKTGFSPENFRQLLQQTKIFENTRLRGIMVIAPEYPDAELTRPVFRAGYEAFCNLRAARPGNARIDILSMGMSGDFKVAVEEGANNIRLGTAVFGRRNYVKP